MEINLTKGKKTRVDPEDFEKFGLLSWYYQVTDKKRDKGYAARRAIPGRELVLLHRAIMEAPKGLEVDHINGDRLDNRRVNLRLATRQENSFNRVVRKDSVAGFKGVRRKHSKWQAYISVGKFRSLGVFKTPEEAAKAYDLEAKKLFGKYASLNFPKEG